MRPMTLITPSKFPAYLQKAGRWQEAGRPRRVDGRWVKPDVFSGNSTPNCHIPAGFRGNELFVFSWKRSGFDELLKTFILNFIQR